MKNTFTTRSFLAALAAILLTLALAPIAAQAATEINGIYYDLDAGRNTATVADNSSASGKITIPNTVRHGVVDYAVIAIGGSAFEGCLIHRAIP